MKLTYIANVRLPTEKAHGIQIMKMCEAFARNGAQVTLVVPDRWQANGQLKQVTPFEYYCVEPIFLIKRLWNIDLLALSLVGVPIDTFAYYLQELTFSLSAVVTQFQSQLIYTRSRYVAYLLSLANRRVMYEAHDSYRASPIDAWLAQHISIVTIAQAIDSSWRDHGAKTIYAPDGVSGEFFESTKKTQARKQLKLNINKPIILYTGNLYPWKGVDTFIQAAKSRSEYQWLVVGGSQIDKNIQPLVDQTKHFDHISILGHRPYQEIPLWLQAADVLVIPNSAKYDKGKRATSPLKLFEYMASGRPIIAADVPAIREVVDTTMVTFFEPDNPIDLTSKIKQVQKKSTSSQKKAQKAIQIAEEYTWEKRAGSIWSQIS